MVATKFQQLDGVVDGALFWEKEQITHRLATQLTHQRTGGLSSTSLGSSSFSDTKKAKSSAVRAIVARPMSVSCKEATNPHSVSCWRHSPLAHRLTINGSSSMAGRVSSAQRNRVLTKLLEMYGKSDDSSRKRRSS